MCNLPHLRLMSSKAKGSLFYPCMILGARWVSVGSDLGTALSVSCPDSGGRLSVRGGVLGSQFQGDIL